MFYIETALTVANALALVALFFFSRRSSVPVYRIFSLVGIASILACSAASLDYNRLYFDVYYAFVYLELSVLISACWYAFREIFRPLRAFPRTLAPIFLGGLSLVLIWIGYEWIHLGHELSIYGIHRLTAAMLRGFCVVALTGILLFSSHFRLPARSHLYGLVVFMLFLNGTHLATSWAFTFWPYQIYAVSPVKELAYLISVLIAIHYTRKPEKKLWSRENKTSVIRHVSFREHEYARIA